MTTIRKSHYCDGDNCSVVQVREGQVYVYGKQLYVTVDPEIDYCNDKVAFYEMVDRHSLNQAVRSKKILYLPLNIAFDVLDAFKEIDKENETKLSRLFKSK